MRAKLVVVIACLLASASALARGRLIRLLDARQGLAVPSVTSLAQDSRGFLWIGSIGGLQRYDGQEVRRVAPDVLVTQISLIRPTPDGALIVVDAGGVVHRVADERATPVIGPDGKPLVEIDDLWVERNGTVWTVGFDHSIHRRDRDGRWSAPLGALDKPRMIRGAPDGSLYVASRKRVWRVTASGLVVIAHAERIIDVLPAADGTLYVLESHGHLWRTDGHSDVMTEVFYYNARGITLTQRADVIWMVLDSALIAISPHRSPDILRREDGFASGGPLLVDAEGSLWLGTYGGLQQFPEPDTAIWDVPDGLPASPRFVVETPEGIWVSAWTGLGRIDPVTGKTVATGRDVRSGVCVDGTGRLWGTVVDNFIVRVAGTFVEYPAPNVVLPNPCDTGPTGRVWFAFRDGIYATRSDREPEHVAAPPPGDDTIDAVHEDLHGRIWVAVRELVCWAKLDRKIEWQCQRIAGVLAVTDFEETETGALWASTEQGGIQRWNETAAHWEPVEPSLHLPSRAIMGLSPSPRGGMWVLGHGMVLRVRERGAGWEILESPTAWNGLPAVDALDAIETKDGTLWIVGLGLYEIPSHVRGQVPLAPPVTLTDVRVDGERGDPARTLELPYGRNLLQLAFSALSYRDPSLVRYRVRLASDAEWSEPIRRPALQLAEIAPGSHSAEISASLDGVSWSPPTVLVYEVRGPFWREPWAIALFAAGLFAIGFVVYRIRIAMQLRLERQRVHIAMDLHDEMGSGLGSIGILASLATNAELPDAKRRNVTAEIIEAAEDLGESLGDIVWSLRRGSNTLDALVAHILERGARVLPGSGTEGGVELSTDLPSPIPPVVLSLVVCRSLQLVCFEALYNAARHAHAQYVCFGLSRVDRRRWRFWIDDDGVGLSGDEATRRPGSGLGLASMRSRAESIGAELRIGSRPTGGTRVDVIFDPGTPERTKRGAAS